MKRLFTIGLLCGAFLAAQQPALSVPTWRSRLSTLPPTPPPNTTAQDILQFERNMRVAATYLGNTTPAANPAQWEENRALVRRMAAYLYGLQAMYGSNSQLRGSIYRAQRSFEALGFAPYLAYGMAPGEPYPADQAAGPIPPPPQEVRTALPPFALNAPDGTAIPEADRQTADELRTRYEADANRSAAVWQNAETLRQNLEAHGMGLNMETATAMVRMPQHFNQAASALRRNDWEGAKTHLEQAEAETAKMAKTVGH